MLGEGDDVHVTLDDDDFVEVAVVLACFIEAVELLAFMKDRGFRRVQVFRLVVAEYPATESDDAAAGIADREHHAIAEAVIAFAGFGVLDQQAGVDHGLLLQSVAAQMFEQVVPARRREAETEVPGDLAGQSAALEIIHRSLARRMTLERLAVEIGGGGEQRVQRRIGWLPRFVRAATFFAGDFHAGGFGQVLNRLGEIQVVVVHEKAEGVATGAATEAVIELLVRADAERWGFLFMERAAGSVVLAGLFQLHARADHVDDVGAVQEVVNKALGNQPGHGVLVCAVMSPMRRAAGRRS